jgi:hypothetical protein
MNPKLGIWLFLLLVIPLSQGCKKEKDPWVWCMDCSMNDLIGQFEGKGYYVHADNSVELFDQPVYLNISEQGIDGLTVQVGILNRFYMGIGGQYRPAYYLSFGSISEDFYLTIWKNNDKIKLSGTAKRFYSKTVGDVEYKITNELLDFEVFPVED